MADNEEVSAISELVSSDIKNVPVKDASDSKECSQASSTSSQTPSTSSNINNILEFEKSLYPHGITEEEQDFLQKVADGLLKHKPIRLSKEDSGVYMIYCEKENDDGQKKVIAVFKPSQEELHKSQEHQGCAVGEGALREMVAYKLDSIHLKAGVPMTLFVVIFGGDKSGSLQKFVKGEVVEDIYDKIFSPQGEGAGGEESGREEEGEGPRGEESWQEEEGEGSSREESGEKEEGEGPSGEESGQEEEAEMSLEEKAWKKKIHSWDVVQKQRIFVLDLWLGNLDRHMGNLIADKNILIPIDHGCAFPDHLFVVSKCLSEYLRQGEDYYDEVKVDITNLDSIKQLQYLKEEHEIEFGYEHEIQFHACTRVLQIALEKRIIPAKLGDFLCTEPHKRLSDEPGEVAGLFLMVDEIFENLKQANLVDKKCINGNKNMKKVFEIIDTSVCSWLDEFQKNNEAYGQRLKNFREKCSNKIEKLTKEYLPHLNEKLKKKYKELIQDLKTKKYLTAQQISEEEKNFRMDCKILTEELTEEAFDGN